MFLKSTLLTNLMTEKNFLEFLIYAINCYNENKKHFISNKNPLCFETELQFLIIENKITLCKLHFLVLLKDF